METKEERKDYDKHHIVWHCNHHRFNVWCKENEKIIKKKKHTALNTLFGALQSPKEQLEFMFTDIWFTTLSQETKQKIYDLINTLDKDFYAKVLTKGKM